MSLRAIAQALCLAFLILVITLHLQPAFLAGLFSFMVLDVLSGWFGRVVPRELAHRAVPRVPRMVVRWLALLLFLSVAVLALWAFFHFAKLAFHRLPQILDSALPQIATVVHQWGFELPFDNLQELRAISIEALGQNVPNISKASGLLTKGFFQVVVAIVVATLVFFSLSGPARPYQPNLFDALRQELNRNVSGFMRSFRRVVGAQVVISSINTVLTAIFLAVSGIPYLPFLVLATFTLGLLPVVGNIVSNSIIFCTAMTVSTNHAVAALVYLVLIHKGEYFLNGRIVGSSIDVPMWQTLLGLLLGEALMGITGIVLAPALIHYVRSEMQRVPAQPPG